MNTHDIELPPLPDCSLYISGQPGLCMINIDRMYGILTDYARTAIEAALQSPEVQALKKDAERYRWLRAGGNDDMGVVTGFDCIDIGSTGVVGTYEEGLEGEQLDKVIDHARRIEGEKSCA